MALVLGRNPSSELRHSYFGDGISDLVRREIPFFEPEIRRRFSDSRIALRFLLALGEKQSEVKSDTKAEAPGQSKTNPMSAATTGR